MIYAAQPESCRLHPHLVIYRLTAWTQDEIIEYLLAAHKRRCAAVMARVHDDDHDLLGGAPELWRIVLDRLAQDDTLPDVRRACIDISKRTCATPICWNEAQRLPERRRRAGQGFDEAVGAVARPGFADGLIRVLRHPPAQRLLAAERIAAELHGDGDCDCLATRLPRDLVRSAATLVAKDPRALEHLHRLLAGPSWSHAMSASLLHAAGIAWILPAKVRPCWRGRTWTASAGRVWICRAPILGQTDLSAADLSQANLTQTNAREIDLRVARLHAARLDGIMAIGSRSELTPTCSETRASRAVFNDACLEGPTSTGPCSAMHLSVWPT